MVRDIPTVNQAKLFVLGLNQNELRVNVCISEVISIKPFAKLYQPIKKLQFIPEFLTVKQGVPRLGIWCFIHKVGPVGPLGYEVQVASQVRCRQQLLVLHLLEDSLGIYFILIQAGIDEHPDYLASTVKHPSTNVAQALEHPMNFGVFFLILLNISKPSPPDRDGIEILAQIDVTINWFMPHGLKVWLIIEDFLVKEGFFEFLPCKVPSSKLFV